MELKSVSGLVFYVANLDRTVQFYTTLGFRPGKRDAQTATFYLNWFSLEFREADPASPVVTGGDGPFICVKVDDIAGAHATLTEQDILPLSEPARQASGSTEFVVRDPDGHRLLFFQK